MECISAHPVPRGGPAIEIPTCFLTGGPWILHLSLFLFCKINWKWTRSKFNFRKLNYLSNPSQWKLRIDHKEHINAGLTNKIKPLCIFFFYRVWSSGQETWRKATLLGIDPWRELWEWAGLTTTTTLCSQSSLSWLLILDKQFGKEVRKNPNLESLLGDSRLCIKWPKLLWLQVLGYQDFLTHVIHNLGHWSNAGKEENSQRAKLQANGLGIGIHGIQNVLVSHHRQITKRNSQEKKFYWSMHCP